MIKRGIPGAVVALALIALFSGSGFGQEKKELSLTLEDSIVRALKNNLNVAAEVINPGLAEANVAYAKQMFSPTMEIGLQGDRFEQLSTWSLQSAGTYINRSSSATTSITQKIPFGGTPDGVPELRLHEEQPALPELQPLLRQPSELRADPAAAQELRL